MEVSGYLVGSAAFKAVGTSEPRPAGSIPVHLRQTIQRRTFNVVQVDSSGFRQAAVGAR